MPEAERPLSGSAYLILAAEALREAGHPLTPTEMLELAAAKGFLPDHLYGAAMHKTLSARLSEHIRIESEASAFYRTGPNTFFMHALAKNANIPDEYRKVFIGNLRSKKIRKENILVVPRDVLRQEIFGDYVEFDSNKFDEIYRRFGRFVDRETAELDETVKQFVTYTLVHFRNKLLIYRRGKFTTTSDRLKGQLSVGFGGHVNEHDFTLFSMGKDAFKANAARELREELFLDEMYREPIDTERRSRVMGFINVDDSPDAEHHIAVVVAFAHKNASLPKKGELSINQISWLDVKTPLNDLSDFDLWSGMILRHIYNGTIKL